MTTELTLPERAAIALKSSVTEAHLKSLVESSAGITAITNKAGRDECHAAMMTLKNARTDVTKTGKAAREDATKFSNAVIAEEKRLIAITEKEEQRLQDLRDAWDAERQKEKEAAAEAERKRVEQIRELIAAISNAPANAASLQSELIANAHSNLTDYEITLDTFQEFAGEAMQAKTAALEALASLHQAALAKEEEARRIEAERAELARLRAESEERQRIAQEEWLKQEAAARAERDAHEAAMKAQREELEAQARAQQAEIDRQRLELEAARAEQERIERERQEAIRKEEEAKAAEAARIEAEAQAKEQALIDEQRKLEEAQAKLDQELEEQARRAAHACRNDEEEFLPVDVVNAVSNTLGVSHSRAVELVVMAAEAISKQQKAA